MSNRTNTPNTVLTLANSAKPRRPSGVRVPHVDDPLESAGAAARWLAECGFAADGRAGTLSASELRELRKLRLAVESLTRALAEASAAGRPAPSVPPGALGVVNEIAGECPVQVRLEADLRPRYAFPGHDPVAALAATCVRELADCDPTRVKACARRECGHFFYDTTRNRSTLWHAEDPCGWRMRSARRTAGQVGHLVMPAD